ncbi:MAG TPA: dTDP-glucose 4,6-dehydratase, partial [Bacteroidales bacterium]|nr:dTDP-glucose 4,6-dehydratase [Bacteroidales bacterium]
IRRFVNKYPNYRIINMDCLTYAGNLENLKDVEHSSNYQFAKVDICDADAVAKVFADFEIDGVIHLAAESHVDRSITNPMEFIKTNIEGTIVLLNAARIQWGDNFNGKRFYHISTDEVYGSLGDEGLFTETTAYDPRSPYSASKASSDHLVRAYFHTFKLPVVISNCSNNYGANQFPEKLIPLIINNIKSNKPLPVYGKGLNVRDWLYVEDHAAAIDTIFHNGELGETYNVGGNNEWRNIDLVKELCRIMDKKLNRKEGESEKLITFVTDRAGHDLRYAIDITKIQHDLGWEPTVKFNEGLELTVDWYLQNEEWIDAIVSGEYQTYYQLQYGKR